MIMDEKLVEWSLGRNTEDDMGKGKLSSRRRSAFKILIAHASPTAAWFSAPIMFLLVAEPFASTRRNGKRRSCCAGGGSLRSCPFSCHSPSSTWCTSVKECWARPTRISGFGVISRLFKSGSSIAETAVVSLVVVAISLGLVREGGLVGWKVARAVAERSAAGHSRGIAYDSRSWSDGG
jgi:hypothetical protein